MSEIYRVHKAEKQFTTNDWPNYITYEVKDKRLSPKSLLILLYIRGQSESWTPRKKIIMEQAAISSNNSYEKYIKELIECGYVSMTRGRKPITGHWYSEYVFYFDPVDNPNFNGELPSHYFDREDYIKEKINTKKTQLAGEPTGLKGINDVAHISSIDQKPNNKKNNEKKYEYNMGTFSQDEDEMFEL